MIVTSKTSAWLLCLLTQLVVLSGCAGDIDLGGSSEQGQALVQCSPCYDSDDCQSGGSCMHLDGNRYCLSSCSTDVPCPDGFSCQFLKGVTGQLQQVCVRNDKSCPPAGPLVLPDGSQVLVCGSLVAPEVLSSCTACQYDCQLNGCYGGWWCNVQSGRCVSPPSECH
jgi:hypothetical protein